MPSRIANLVNRLGRGIHSIQFAEGLNPAQWEALRFLARANRYSRTPTALAAYLRTTKGTASQTLKSLTAKGYVRRAPVPADKRAVRLDLTASGQGLLARDPLRRLEAAAAALGPELESANRILSRLAGGLEAATGQIEFGLCGECTHFCKNAAAAQMPAAKVTAGPHRCGLTGEGLSAAESAQICVDFGPRPGAPDRSPPAAG
jgi:DNA-binding MarR family transcriptional regulator